MDPSRLDSFSRALASATTRRGVLAGLGAVFVAARSVAGQSCPPGQTANRRGKCSCPAGTDPCDNGCFDKKRDPNNCGACGRTCGGGACVKGSCVCPAGTEQCIDGCKDLSSDVNNCAFCGDTCFPIDDCTPAACFDGQCLFTSACTGGEFCGLGQTANECGPPTDACPVPAAESSFFLSCDTIRLRCTSSGTELTARCGTDGGSTSASITVNDCSVQGFEITNCGGRLVCGGVCPP